MLGFTNFLSYKNCFFDSTPKLVNSLYSDDFSSILFDNAKIV